jgi:RNA polymerase sigma factor (sigma-70 family)
MTRETVAEIRTRAGDGAGSFLSLQPDAQLLEIFVADRDSAAFEVLVTRHGPRVLRVCRQVLGRSPDAEDAFQATFLLLARKACSIRNRASLGHWLHGVAHRLAIRSRADAARRRNLEIKAPVRSDDGPVEADVDVDELRLALHEEIDRLPARLREPVLLCYLEGRTNEEAARLLGCPTSTLKERLARSREVLRSRLARRGLALSTLLLLLLLPARAPAEAVPPRLLQETVDTMRRRSRRHWRFRAGGEFGEGPRMLFIAIVASMTLALGAVVALAAPTPRRGTWLASLIEPVRRACH